MHNFSCTFISILRMFRAAMCPSSGELLYQCDAWFMSLCVDDRLVCRSMCSSCRAYWGLGLVFHQPKPR